MWCSRCQGCSYYQDPSCTSCFRPFKCETILTMDCRARWLLPTLEILWGICTFAQSRVSNVHQLYALRFLVGMFEAPVFAGTHFILGKFQLWSLMDTSLTGQIQALGTPAPTCSSAPGPGSSAIHLAKWSAGISKQPHTPTSRELGECQGGGGSLSSTEFSPFPWR